MVVPLVAAALEVDVAHLVHGLRGRRPDPPEVVEVAPRVRHLADPHEADGDDRTPVQRLGQEWGVAGGHHVARQRGWTRGVVQAVAPGAHRSPGRRLAEVEVEVRDERPTRRGVEPELELGHDPEVAAAAAQPPEQVRVLRRCSRAGSGHPR